MSICIKVLEKEGKYHCMVQELSILEIDSDLKSAYDRAEKKKQEITSRIKEADLENLFFPKNSPLPPKRFTFSLHWLLGLIALAIPLVSITKPLSLILTRVAHVLEFTPVDMALLVERRLKTMDPESKQKLRAALQEIASEIDLSVLDEKVSGSHGLHRERKDPVFPAPKIP